MLILASLAISTGLWQVAGGHGKINVEKAIQEMKKYADAGFYAFDLADICKFQGVKYWMDVYIFNTIWDLERQIFILQIHMWVLANQRYSFLSLRKLDIHLFSNLHWMLLFFITFSLLILFCSTTTQFLCSKSVSISSLYNPTCEHLSWCTHC